MKIKEKKLVAKEALFFVKDKQTIGLGSGSTMEIFVKLLARKVKREKLKIKVVASSDRIERLAKKNKLKIIKTGEIDVAIDGADKIDDKFRITKGFGAFEFVNEKKIDYRAEKTVIIADSSKFVKNVFSFPILIASKKKPKANFISGAEKVKEDIWKIKLKKEVSEEKLNKIGKNGLFTKFKQLIVIGADKGRTFINLREKLLQVAVDIANEKKARKIINKTARYVDIIEIGTPLIELAGVKFLRRINGKKLVMADIKAADVGSYETEIAAKEGADIVSILAGSSNKTILKAIKKAKKHNKKVLVDLIDVKQERREKRLKEILKLKLKPDIVCIHIAIDVQDKEKFYNLKNFVNLCKKNKVLVALAGGLTRGKIKKLKKYDADIYVVGSAITKAKNPGKEAKKLRELLE
jgi:ribose 5-phosphate isomerase